MCGISGIIVGDGGPPRATIEHQLNQLHHRGPDAVGCFRAGPGAVAQNRLAVIDLTTGDPPITNESETIGVVLNGEIYNYQSLRDSLRASGHQLRSRGDTEVLAHLAEELAAVEIARRLDGMFAFAVWDAERGRLILGRDRLGKKPLYYAYDGRRLVFGSEIKAVLSDPAVERSLNPRAIPAYLTFGYVPTPETFFRGVLSLPPGHVLTYSPGRPPIIERYWKLPVAGIDDIAHLDVGIDEAARLVREALTRAVERRLMADVPVGAFLSGGVDSSAIVAIMATVTDQPVKTFTIGFDHEHGFDERPYARELARRYSTEHHEYVVRANTIELLDTLLWHHDQPFGDSSAIPTYLVNQATRQEVTVALSGDGGDELFAGYERFAAAMALGGYGRLPQNLRRVLSAVASRLPPHAAAGRAESAQRFISADGLPLLDGYRTWLSFFDESTRTSLVAQPDDWALRDYASHWAETAGAAPLDRLLALNLQTYLLDDLLVKADRMSMAHALEVRTPFLDVELVELASRLPPRHKLGAGRRKRVLRAAVRDLLPSAILRRRKHGFGVPLDHWFRHDLRDSALRELQSPGSRIREHLQPLAIDQLVTEHLGRRRNHGQRLWLLLTLERFLLREGW